MQVLKIHNRSGIFARQNLLLAMLLLILALSSCGFQLRKPLELPPQLSPILIQGIDQYDDLSVELKKLLSVGSQSFTDRPKQAASRLQISLRNKSRRIVSVDSRGKAAEYVLQESLEFSLIDGQGKILVQRQSINVQRSYIHSNEQLLGKQHEQSDLRAEMSRDLAHQILIRLKAALKKAQ